MIYNHDTFLSDLCGREELLNDYVLENVFLSDLCGREEYFTPRHTIRNFLSDLCGREGPQNWFAVADVFSKRPVRS